MGQEDPVGEVPMAQLSVAGNGRDSADGGRGLGLCCR